MQHLSQLFFPPSQKPKCHRRLWPPARRAQSTRDQSPTNRQASLNRSHRGLSNRLPSDAGCPQRQLGHVVAGNLDVRYAGRINRPTSTAGRGWLLLRLTPGVCRSASRFQDWALRLTFGLLSGRVERCSAGSHFARLRPNAVGCFG